jgi:teichuronic acid biosynthesis protein TuaE
MFYISCGLAIIITLIYYATDIKTQENVFNILSIVFIIEIILSLLESFTSFRLPVSPFSQYVTYFGRNIKIYDEFNSDIISIILQSPTGFQWNPNNLAVTMLIISPFFLLHSNNKIKYLGIISILTLIVTSGSKAVFISFVFMLFLYIVFLNKKRLIIFLSTLPLIIVLLLINLEGLKTNENEKIREIASSFDALILYFDDNTDNANSIGVRQQLIINGLAALKDSNYLGVGGGGSMVVQENYGDINGFNLTSMHNFWIEMLVESGVFFTIIFFMWYIYIIIKLYLIGIYTKHVQLKYHAQALFLAMSAFLLGAVSASSVIYLLPMWLMFGFAIATINNYERYKYETTATI